MGNGLKKSWALFNNFTCSQSFLLAPQHPGSWNLGVFQTLLLIYMEENKSFKNLHKNCQDNFLHDILNIVKDENKPQVQVR